MDIESQIEVLIELGYIREEVMDALEKCGGNLKQALTLLVPSDFDEEPHPEPNGESEPDLTRTDALDNCDGDLKQTVTLLSNLDFVEESHPPVPNGESGPDFWKKSDTGASGVKKKESTASSNAKVKNGKPADKTTMLQIHLPNGETLTHPFKSGMTLQSLRETLVKIPQVEPDFELMRVQPLDAGASLKTLKDLGMFPSATLIVTNKQEEPSNQCFEEAPSEVYSPLNGEATKEESEESREIRDQEWKKYCSRVQQEKEKERAYRAEILRRIEEDKKERKVKFQYV